MRINYNIFKVKGEIAGAAVVRLHTNPGRHMSHDTCSTDVNISSISSVGPSRTFSKLDPKNFTWEKKRTIINLFLKQAFMALSPGTPNFTGTQVPSSITHWEMVLNCVASFDLQTQNNKLNKSS